MEKSITKLTVKYAKDWSQHKKMVLRELTENKAKILHERRKYYAIIFYKEGSPYCCLYINNSYLQVCFLDTLNRVRLNYYFGESKKYPEKIYLREIQEWKYRGDTDEKIFSTRYKILEDGRYGVQNADIEKNLVEESEGVDKVDVTPLYEDYPEFGHYDEIIKEERQELKFID